MTSASDKPKIIVDEDWKQRVEKEREIEAQIANQPDPNLRGFPPASFELLISTFSSQALLGLGFLVNPQTGQGHVDLELAKHAIDMLAVIQEKTRGNLTAAESDLLEDTIHQLRLSYISVSADTPKGSSATSKLELP